MTLSRGDVVLVMLPFTDQTGMKKRPAVVIANESYLSGSDDVIVQAVSGQEAAMRFPGSCEIRDWQVTGLCSPSVVKGTIFTVNRGIIEKRLGRLSSADLRQVNDTLNAILF
ncbi:type II toxin-antitoxin system PemK/MazF family toxin [Candidatus Sumerlaeota bacterium]|nr:type II toxin-antitoxin system PemK/MazF family toxin [Candidatus Sumerlaeota bacterium]MBI3735941.1 type II toxin-antitoxin system PemK/MazF family toxin [Candidatus Sumerlaeota bacterium]